MHLKEFQEKGYAIEKLEKILEFSQIKGSIADVEKVFDVNVGENDTSDTYYYGAFVWRTASLPYYLAGAQPPGLRQLNSPAGY